MNRELLMLVEAISREKNVERDVVLAAVAKDGMALQFARSQLKNRRVVVLVAVVGLQILYQAIRLLRLVPMIQEFYSIASPRNLEPNSPLGDAILLVPVAVLLPFIFEKPHHT